MKISILVFASLLAVVGCGKKDKKSVGGVSMNAYTIPETHSAEFVVPNGGGNPHLLIAGQQYFLASNAPHNQQAMQVLTAMYNGQQYQPRVFDASGRRYVVSITFLLQNQYGYGQQGYGQGQYGQYGQTQQYPQTLSKYIIVNAVQPL